MIDEELIMLEDGYWYWEPMVKGALSSYNLRAIADHLDKLNAPWDREITEYFEKNK